MKTIAVKLCSMEPGRKSHILKGIFMVEAIFLLVLIVITSTPAFYYKTDARNAKTACLMEDNMSMSQMLPANRGGGTERLINSVWDLSEG